MSNIWILAEAEQAETNGEGAVVGMEETNQTTQTATQQNGGSGTETPPPPPPKNPWMSFLPLILIFVVMYMLMFRGPKKKQQEHQKMVAALSKNDRVRTIGGIFGTVLDVRDDEIVLKIDESTNTKIRISPSAIATVLKDGKTE